MLGVHEPFDEGFKQFSALGVRVFLGSNSPDFVDFVSMPWSRPFLGNYILNESSVTI